MSILPDLVIATPVIPGRRIPCTGIKPSSNPVGHLLPALYSVNEVSGHAPDGGAVVCRINKNKKKIEEEKRKRKKIALKTEAR